MVKLVKANQILKQVNVVLSIRKITRKLAVKTLKTPRTEKTHPLI